MGSVLNNPKIRARIERIKAAEAAKQRAKAEEERVSLEALHRIARQSHERLIEEEERRLAREGDRQLAARQAVIDHHWAMMRANEAAAQRFREGDILCLWHKPAQYHQGD
jgi:hypothetical protein